MPPYGSSARLFVPLVLLPTQALWDGMDVHHITPSEAVSVDDGDRPIADVTEPSDSTVVGASTFSWKGPSLQQQVLFPPPFPLLPPKEVLSPLPFQQLFPKRVLLPSLLPQVLPELMLLLSSLPRLLPKQALLPCRDLLRSPRLFLSFLLPASPLPGSQEVGALSVKLYSPAIAYPELHGAMCALLDHARERTRWKEALECIAAFASSCEGVVCHVRVNRSVRAMSARDNEALARLLVES